MALLDCYKQNISWLEKLNFGLLMCERFVEVLELVKFLEILLVNYVLEFLLSERHIFYNIRF